MKNKWLETYLVPAYVPYCLCTTEELFLEKTKELKCKNPPKFLDKLSSAHCHRFADEKTGGISIVVTIDTNQKDRVILYSSLVHEAVHIWQDTREQIGEDKPSYEFEAISIAKIAEDLMREYEKQLADK